ncbi:hypothetical protein HO133_006530 [Letharia lupina]|uniref:Fungal N-terminal domain-containing protein n=1 Tax=Letharia lupina TaxID=560253 RepID=A0A8H6C6I5_9LECA|nr:uncharacterized protein HO133_006530 [Letharia lupina]KAF6217703.1 hypothetical protein HO133_006530 [Letharia lupina]
MDPISAAASIIGLLGAAAKVSDVLLKFIGSVKGAPKLAQNVLMEISDVSACLNQLQRYLQGALSTSNSQEQLLMVEQLVVTLSNCVLIFSELEEAVDSLKPAEPMQSWRLAQWLFKEQAICALMLTTLIQQVLESNLEMSQRMANLEMRTFGLSRSAAPTLAALNTSRDDDSIKTMRAANDVQEKVLGEHFETIEETNQKADKESTNDQGPTFSFTFDQDLNSSRPYTRAMKRNSVWSTAPSTVHTMSWSCLSGLSLADVSEISVIGLPISPQELWNGHHYILANSDMNDVPEKPLAPNRDDLAYRPDESFYEDESEPLETRKGLFPYDNAQSVGGSLDLRSVDGQGRKIPIAAGGRLLEPKKIILLGATMAGKTTTYHRLQMTHGNDFTDSDRRRARESVIHGLVDVFKKARGQYQDPISIEDIEVCSRMNIPIICKA